MSRRVSRIPMYETREGVSIMEPGPVDLIVTSIVLLYLCGMLGIGWWSSQRIEKNEDFMVAGRRLGPLMLAGTLAATEVGGGSSMGVTEKAFGEWGLSAAWYVLAMALTFLMLMVIAPKLRLSEVKTVPEYFRKRYGRATGLLTAIFLILPMIGLTAIQLMASATVLTVMTGWDYSLSVFVVTIVVAIYSIMGGLWSVTLTDIVQLFFILGGTLLVIPFALEDVGGWDTVVANVEPKKLSPTEGIGWKTIFSLTIMYFASFAVGQESMQRFFAARDEKAARLGSFYACVVYVIYAFMPAVIGLIALAMVNTGQLSGELITSHGTRYVLPVMARQVLPSVVVGLLFAALISATMSSADSNLLAAGSIFSNDIYQIHLKPDATDKQVLWMTRAVMIAVSILSLVVALLDFQDIVKVLMFSFTLRAGGVFVPYVLGHYWPKPGAPAAIGAIVAGSAVVLAAEKGLVPTFGFHSVIPGILASGVAFLGLTALAPQPRDSA
jgi:SSS family solute:Na+ symporter